MQLVCPSTSANVPAAQAEQGLRDKNDSAGGPNLPAAHTVPAQLVWSVVLVYIPGLQLKQLLPMPLYVPFAQQKSAAQSVVQSVG